MLFFVLRFLSYWYKFLVKLGFLVGVFVCGYGVIWLFVEFFWVFDVYIGYLSGFLMMGIFLFVFMILVGIVVMVWLV